MIHVNCWPCVYWFMDVVCCNYCQKFITALGSLLPFLLLPFSFSSFLQNTISSTFSSAYNYFSLSSSFLLWVNFTIVPSFDTSKTSSLDLSISVCYTLSRVRLFATPWAVAHQSPLSMGFSRPDKCSGLPFFPPGDIANPGIKPGSPALAGRFFTI